MPDQNFDSLLERFQKQIYQGNKGEIRLSLLRDDLQAQGLFTSSGLKILDIGCGFAQLSQELAMQGHELTLCDVSQRMLDQVQQQQAFPNTTCFIQGAFQDLGTEHLQQYDVVLLHAVLEWLENPQQGLQQAVNYLKPGGLLSLLAFNVNSVLLRRVMIGDWQALDVATWRNKEGTLNPQQPLNLEQVESWLADLPLQRLDKAGVRCLHDICLPEVQQRSPLEAVLSAEKRFRRQEPWVSLARYVHYQLCKI